MENINYHNEKHYSDPTAQAALSNVRHEEKKHKLILKSDERTKEIPLPEFGEITLKVQNGRVTYTETKLGSKINI